MSSTLHDFTDTEPIVIREVKPVKIPRKSSLIGYIGPSNRDANAIVVQRRRHPYQKDGETKQHFYRKLGGYTFPAHDLEKMQSVGVDHLVIEEVDNDRVLEFELSQYLKSGYGGNVGGDDQYGIPVDEALYTWTASEATIIRDH